MFFDLDIWRLGMTFGFAKSLTWSKEGNLYLFHVGTIRADDEVAVKIIFLPFLLMVQWH